MFPDKCFGFSLESVDEFTEIVPSAFETFIGHHKGLFVCVKSVLEGESITLQKYVSSENK